MEKHLKKKWDRAIVIHEANNMNSNWPGKDFFISLPIAN